MINFEESSQGLTAEDAKEEKEEPTKEQAKEQSAEVKKEAQPAEEVKSKVDPNMVGRVSVDARRDSISVGASVPDLTGKPLKHNVHEVVEGEAKPPAKLQEELQKANIKREQQYEPKKISNFDVINQDPTLKNYESDINFRVNTFKNWIKKFDDSEDGILGLTDSYKKFGLNRVKGGIEYREWAPCAKKVCLCGDFNGWNRKSHECKRNQYGVWELFVPDLPDGTPAIKHGSKVKAAFILATGEHADRNPAWIRYIVQNKETVLYDGIYWDPPEPFKWQHEHVKEYPKTHRIYECHIGMSSEEGKINSFRNFADYVIPRIKKNGYNVIQLMAVMEHAYYASFGYHVTNFFAVSSRFGTPDDFKYLVDKAHENNLMVIIDCIHSHASNNVMDGINFFDGTDHQYFHSGPRGYHKLWDSRLFNFSSWEVIRFLLSCLRMYMEEYKVDGFRFDAVTCIMFAHHGINVNFSGGYHEYFGGNADVDGIVYLMMANHLVHKINPNAITVAEDVSGMPTLCRPVSEGGIGFDYRLNMSIPDKWIQLLKETKDENWNMGNITHTLTNRRYNEKCIAYVESHDQAIVGDKTTSMWLFDREIYDGMAIGKHPSLVVDRGMALHKMLRLITFALGGEAYLNFMGNEFGHPEWVDFPRPGNNWSYHFCRRQWHLVDDRNLRYHMLNNFDEAMLALDEKYGILGLRHQYITLAHESDKVIVFERGDLLFIMNFHPNNSYVNYRIGTLWGSDYKIVFNTDDSRFGGRDRLKNGEAMRFPYLSEGWCNRPYSIMQYIPSRTAIVLISMDNLKKYESAKE